MLDAALEWLGPILENGILALITYLLARLSLIAPTALKAVIDRVRQEALHRAVKTGVDLMLAAVDKTLTYHPATAGVVIATDHVWKSSPGIIKWFFKKNTDAAQAHILKLIRAQLVDQHRFDVVEKIDEAGGWRAPNVPTK